MGTVNQNQAPEIKTEETATEETVEETAFLNKNSLDQNTPMKIQIPFNDIVHLIQWIIKNKPRGGILCFFQVGKKLRTYITCFNIK